MSGDKYREIGSRKVIHVGCGGSDYNHLRWAIYHGTGLYQGRLGERSIQDKSWATEAEAQAFLDRVARVRGWKRVTK